MILASLTLLAALSHAKTVRFPTADGWTLEADYAAARKGRPVVVLVHGVAAGRGEWEAFASTLQARGYGTLALDLRGHGGSAGKGDFRSFDATGEWPKMTADVEAAERWLGAAGVPRKRVILVGASIGANLCARAYTHAKDLRGLVLLSPGVDYRGATLPRFDASRAAAAAAPDDGYAYATVRKAASLLPRLRVLEAKSGHGAQMLADPAFVRRLLAFLDTL